MFVVKGTKGTCVVYDSIFVNVFKNDENEIYIPNAFSPNGDGKNDCFKIRHHAKFSDYYLAVYDRWGERVFETANPDECWNGNYKGEVSTVSTFYYFLKGATPCGDIFRKGDILLIR